MKTRWPQGNSRQPKATPERCAREVVETVPVVMRFLRAEMRRYSSARLSVPQFRALAFVGRMPGTSLSEVAADLGVSLPTASAMVERLVQRKVMERTQDPRERRRIILRLNREGARLLEHFRAMARARLTHVLAPRSKQELQALERGLSVLRSVFELSEGKSSRK